MSLNIFWFLPTHGDGHYLGTAEGARAVDHGYLQQIAQAADRLGFGGVLIPTGRSCEDSWLVAASLIPVTQRLKFLVALRPGIISPTVAARQAATLDRLSNGRALFNLVTGGDPDELAGDGLNLSHAERYEASVEFTRIWRRVLEGETVDYAGKHIQVKGAKLLYPPIQQPRPPLYFGGSSEAAQDLAAEQVELYLTWGEPPAAVAEKIAEVRAKAAAQGREVRFGIRLHVIVRETNAEAWAAADKLISHVDDDTIAHCDETHELVLAEVVGPALAISDLHQVAKLVLFIAVELFAQHRLTALEQHLGGGIPFGDKGVLATHGIGTGRNA